MILSRVGCSGPPPEAGRLVCKVQEQDVVLEIQEAPRRRDKKLDYELKVVLPKEILKAREHGDLRENAEYKSAKERQKFLEARIGQLHRRAAALSMANLDKIPRDKVGLGSTVSLRHTDTGRRDRLRDRHPGGVRSDHRPHLARVAHRQVAPQPRGGRHRRGARALGDEGVRDRQARHHPRPGAMDGEEGAGA